MIYTIVCFHSFNVFKLQDHHQQSRQYDSIVGFGGWKVHGHINEPQEECPRSSHASQPVSKICFTFR